MRFRLFLISLLAVCVLACGPDAPPDNPTARADLEVAGPALNTAADDASAQRTFTQNRVDRMDRMYLEGRLRCDTVRYHCDLDNLGGTFTFCYLGEDLVKADHLLESPRPTLVYTEVYYLEDGDVYFAALASDPPTADGAGLPTLETRYYFDGNLIDRTGPELQGGIGSDAMLQVAEEGIYACE